VGRKSLNSFGVLRKVVTVKLGPVDLSPVEIDVSFPDSADKSEWNLRNSQITVFERHKSFVAVCRSGVVTVNSCGQWSNLGNSPPARKPINLAVDEIEDCFIGGDVLVHTVFFVLNLRQTPKSPDEGLCEQIYVTIQKLKEKKGSVPLLGCS